MPVVRDFVFDDAGNPAVRKIYLHRRDTGELVGSAQSSDGSAFPILHGAAPTLPDNNATFNDEGTATTGWTASNATLSVASSWLRQTKSAGGSSSSMSKTIGTFTPSGRDWILYGRCRASTDGVGVVWMLNGSQEVSIWFGSSNADTALTPGAVSICGTTSSGGVRNTASCGSGFAYNTDPIDFALQYDSKFGQLACWFREADGRWKMRARVPCDWFSSTSVQVLNATAAPAGAWVEFDHLSLCRPNIVAIGDSICEGKTLFAPNRTLGLTNDESSWQRHAVLFPAVRNNLVVNKGVGSQTSAQILSRIADATGEAPRIVVLHASSNDEAAAISQATRTSNIQSTLNAITAAGQKPILLNAMYGSATGGDNTPTPDLRDYMTTWWSVNADALSGDYMAIDIMAAIIDGSGFMQSGLTQSDGIHPTAAGYAAIGDRIEQSHAPLEAGEYAIATSYSGACYAVALDDDAGTQYNDLILGRVTPV